MAKQISDQTIKIRKWTKTELQKLIEPGCVSYDAIITKLVLANKGKKIEELK